MAATPHSTTDRLYFRDSHRLEFDAAIVAVRESAGRCAVVLDQSAFYPTGGGQPHDTGTLVAANEKWFVEEVTADDAADETNGGEVLHFLRSAAGNQSAAPPAVGTTLHGTVDAARRRDHLQQHSGQHVLSQAFVRAAGLETKSFHLGSESSTIDLEVRGAGITDEIVARAVALANDVVFSDRELRIHVVTQDELARFPVRKQTFHGERIRLIEVADFDVSTCGGTHAHRSGEIGLIAVVGIEKQKGLQRVEFVCGGRALRALDHDHRLIQTLARDLSTAPDQIAPQVQKLVAQNSAQRKRIDQLFELAAAQQALSLIAAAPAEAALHGARLVVQVVRDLSFGEAQTLAKQLIANEPTKGEPIVALLGVAEAGAPKLLFVRSGHPALANLAMGALVKQTAERFGCRGGGSATSAQAGIGDAAQLEGALAAAAELARAQLTSVLPSGLPST